jgi:hypothetical protein
MVIDQEPAARSGNPPLLRAVLHELLSHCEKESAVSPGSANKLIRRLGLTYSQQCRIWRRETAEVRQEVSRPIPAM